MAAPKGNKFALGLSETGRPPEYETAQEMVGKIEQYFDDHLDDNGEDYKKRPTITGLALYLGFASRQSLYDYVDKEDFSYIIKRAQKVVAMSYEEALLTRASTGAIFALKNMGWKDESKVVQTNINSKELTDEEIQELDNKLDTNY